TVMKSKSARIPLSDRLRPTIRVLTQPSVLAELCFVVAERIAPLTAGSGCILPLGFRKQTICLAGHPPEPPHVPPGLPPAHQDHRPVTTIPRIVGNVGARPGRHANVPLHKCDRSPANSNLCRLDELVVQECRLRGV